MLRTKLLGKEEVAENTFALHLARPADFRFRAGQSVDLYLPRLRPGDNLGNSRSLSLASAPCEPDLMVAMRIRKTAFKQAIPLLPDGEELELDGPFGSFTLPQSAERPVVFLAGGIGITPGRAMLTEVVKAGLAHRFLLISSNRRPQDGAFWRELRELAKIDPQVKFVPTVSADGFFPGWEGERGRITRDLLKRHIPDPAEPVYYVAGPLQFALAMRDLLNEFGADDDFIKTDEFSGY